MATKKTSTPPPICMHENVKVGTDEIVVCVDCGEVQEFPSEAAATKPMALAVVESQPLQPPAIIAPTNEDPYYGIAAAPFDERAEAVLSAPIDKALISFRPDGLAYVPQVHYRDALNRAFGRGNWGVRPITAPLLKNNHVYYHGGLYVGGRFVAEGVGEAEYFEESQSASWGSAWESARSDCITRCCKDMGLFKELWDHKFVDPLKQQWMDSERPYCPSCGKPEQVRPSKDGGWFCWAKKGGCGWNGPEPQRGTKGSQPVQAERRGVPATVTRPKAPEPQDPTGKPFPELMNRITALLNKMDSAQREVWQGWLAVHDSASDWKRALDKIEARMKAEVAK